MTSQDYRGRIVYTQDGFTRGTIRSVGVNGQKEIIYADVELDVPNAEGDVFVRWDWTDCKLA